MSGNNHESIKGKMIQQSVTGAKDIVGRVGRKKNRYVIRINTNSGKCMQYAYAFGRTKNIRLKIWEKSAEIRADTAKIYSPEDILSPESFLFADAIRKALLLQMLLYSNSMEIRKISVFVNGKAEPFTYGKDQHAPVYSLISGKLLRPVSEGWKNDSVIQTILSIPKSRYDGRTAALFAYLLSKSKNYESERFLHLWMAFNGMYGHISSISGEKDLTKESKQIGYLLRYYGLGKESLISKDNNSIGQEVSKILRHSDIEAFIREPLRKNIPVDLADAIQNTLNKSQTVASYDISVYGYLLTQFSYYFRCSIIHADKPLDLISYRNDHNLNCLRIINGLLEEFLDEHLPELFIENKK